MSCTRRWRTTSRSVKVQKRMPSIPARIELRFLQPGGSAGGQVDLRHVAGDHRLRAVAEAGEEHLHLLAGGVLRLVEDDERVVQRAAAHEGERRDLDDAALQHLLRAVEVDHVVQRVVERPQVRVDLLGEIAGQEAELLARLDRRAASGSCARSCSSSARRPPSPWPGRSCRCRPGRCRRRCRSCGWRRCTPSARCSSA